MSIERLAEKLRPLMPERMDQWLRARATGDARLRALIDWQIRSTAERLLGSHRGGMLLSLPPEGALAGAINIGTILYGKPQGQAGLELSELLQHVGIFGRSGAGKTNAAFHLLRQLADRRMSWLFLDWKRTARHLLPNLGAPVQVYTAGRSLRELPFNPFCVPPGVEPHAYANLVVDLLASTFTLGDAAVSVVQRALRACYDRRELSPIVERVMAEVNRIPDTERVKGWKVSALRALQGLGQLANVSLESKELATALLSGRTIIELDGLSTAGRQFFVPLLCLWLYHVQLSTRERERLRLVVFIEEAHHFFYGEGRRREERVMDMLLRACREVGIAFVVIDQHPRLISRAALGNTYTSLCFNLKDPMDVLRAAGLSSVADDERHYLSLLPVGQAIVKMQGRWRRPFLVKIPHLRVDKGSMSDADLLRFMTATRSPDNRPGEGQESRIRQVRIPDESLSSEELQFLNDVVCNPGDGVRARYERLGLSGERGNAIRQELVRDGWLEAAVIPVDRSRKVALRLTALGRKRLGLTSGQRHESLAHEYWKREYARWFRQRGWSTRVEASRRGGRVDVLATREAASVAVEVETGASDVVGNVRNCLFSRFGNVVVVATDEAALSVVERQLARASLLIPKRVHVVLRDAWFRGHPRPEEVA